MLKRAFLFWVAEQLFNFPLQHLCDGYGKICFILLRLFWNTTTSAMKWAVRFPLLSDTVGPEDLEYSPEDSGNWMVMILDGLNVSPLTSCPSGRVLSHPRNFQRWPICVHPADFVSLQRRENDQNLFYQPPLTSHQDLSNLPESTLVEGEGDQRVPQRQNLRGALVSTWKVLKGKPESSGSWESWAAVNMWKLSSALRHQRFLKHIKPWAWGQNKEIKSMKTVFWCAELPKVLQISIKM